MPLVLTEPHAAPTQPAPDTPLCTRQATVVLPLPVTLAKNCAVLAEPPGAATNA